MQLKSDLAVFGASMAGACMGFLFHNRYKASVFMGDTGSLALGGALASMAACTGMFFPLFISSGVFVLEALSVILQVSYNILTRFYVLLKFFPLICSYMCPVFHNFFMAYFVFIVVSLGDLRGREVRRSELQFK